jgi:sialidase-1
MKRLPHKSLFLITAVFILGCRGTPTALDAARKGLLEQTEVFVEGQDGVAQYRIPVLLTSNQGTLLAFCDARVDRLADAPNNIDLVMKRSVDGGKTWGPLRVLVDVGEGAACDACGLVDRETGTIWIFMCYFPEGIGSEEAEPGLSGSTALYWALKSDDDGETWSEPMDFTAMIKKTQWRAGSPGPGKGIQTRSGRLILPKYFIKEDEHSTSHVVFSDDHGKSWEIGGAAHSNGTTNECQVAELTDGTLLLNMRHRLSGNHRWVSRSSDGGLTWSTAVKDSNLIGPLCQASLSSFTNSIDHDRDRLLFSNPPSATTRKNMTVRLSYDGGMTWPVAKQLHTGPSAYSCLTVLPDMTIGCFYERGDQDRYEKLTFARFNLEWLTDGKDSVSLDRSKKKTCERSVP